MCLTSVYYQERPYPFRIMQTDNVCTIYSFLSFLNQPSTPGPRELQLPWMVQHMQDLVSAFRCTRGARNNELSKMTTSPQNGRHQRQLVCATVSAQLGHRRVSFSLIHNRQPPGLLQMVDVFLKQIPGLPFQGRKLPFLRETQVKNMAATIHLHGPCGPDINSSRLPPFPPRCILPVITTDWERRKTGHVYQVEYQYYF